MRRTNLSLSIVALNLMLCQPIALLGPRYFGSGKTPNSATSFTLSGRVQLTVRWPEHSRLIPFAANSIRIRIVQGNTLLGETLLVRPADGGNATTTLDRLPTGNAVVQASVYAQADGSGVAQALGQGEINIVRDRTARMGLALESTIDHLKITPLAPLSVKPGETQQLMVTVKDASGAVVITPTNKIVWTTANCNIATVNTVGLVQAVASGSTTIKVTETESGKTATLPITVPPTPGKSNLLAYEGFDYPAGEDIAGKLGGIGWKRGWNDYGDPRHTPSRVADQGLTYPGLKTTGKALQTTSFWPVGNFNIPTYAIGTEGETLYFSLLIRPLALSGTRSGGNSYFGFGFSDMGIGKGNTPFWGIGKNGVTAHSTIPIIANQTYFVVLRATFRSGKDKFEVWINPTVGQPLPLAPDITTENIDTPGIMGDIGLGASVPCLFDEYRVGRTWDSVSPAP
jgi:hypothetical protein